MEIGDASYFVCVGVEVLLDFARRSFLGFIGRRWSRQGQAQQIKPDVNRRQIILELRGVDERV